MDEKDMMVAEIEEFYWDCPDGLFDEYDEFDNNKYKECKNCSELERCHMDMIAKENHEFAESLDYGGYDTEEEFWEQL